MLILVFNLAKHSESNQNRTQAQQGREIGLIGFPILLALETSQSR